MDRVDISQEADEYYYRNILKLDERRNKGLLPDIDFLVSQFSSVGRDWRNILEVGCLDAYKIIRLHLELSGKPHGIDPSPAAIKMSSEFEIQYGIQGDFQVGILENLPWQDGHFDFIFLAFCLYVHDDLMFQNGMKEVSRTLKAFGYVAILDFDVFSNTTSDYAYAELTKCYKRNYALELHALGYHLVSKINYTESDNAIALDPGDRLAVYIFQKL